tara:strand:- start:3336 stop:3578 length:243 start_codon:yes stop_codon:yes gene_type:complete
VIWSKPSLIQHLKPLFTFLGPRSIWPAKGATGDWLWGWVGGEWLQERHLYSRIAFKLNRAAALVEWRQFLSALSWTLPAI